MNLLLKAVYVCTTNGNKWGRGLTIQEAKKNAGLITKAAEKNVQFYVQAACLMNPSDEELQSLLKCVTVDQIDGHPVYYGVNRTKEDDDLIKHFHVGWLMVEKNYKE